ncbi:MAG: MAPEG family protein [Pseudomonadales bacterium]|nr:MAPEG family protein [Pseudomonadales bacterium]
MNDIQPNISSRQWAILLVYPLVPLVVALITNLVVGVNRLEAALPTDAMMGFVALSVLFLIVNHTWLMTHTEVTRARFGLFATPEEEAESDHSSQGVSNTQELTRSHAAHRNLTENTVHFALALPVFLFLSPPAILAAIWLCGYATMRLGHTYFFLSGNADMRGVCMTGSLVALYGLVTYPLISIVSSF